MQLRANDVGIKCGAYIPEACTSHAQRYTRITSAELRIKLSWRECHFWGRRTDGVSLTADGVDTNGI
jgi:hypothetical protein